MSSAAKSAILKPSSAPLIWNTKRRPVDGCDEHIHAFCKILRAHESIRSTRPGGRELPLPPPLCDGTGRDKHFSLRCVFVRSRQNSGRTTINVHAPPRTAAKFLLPSTPAASTISHIAGKNRA